MNIPLVRNVLTFCIWFVLISFWSFPVVAQDNELVLFVDDDNQTGTEDGTSLYPYSSIQKTIDSTLSAEITIKVAKGDYNENIVIQGKHIHLEGGYAGSSETDYEVGAGGDFNERDTITSQTTIAGNESSTVVYLVEAGESVVDGFIITGGIGFQQGNSSKGGGIYIQGGSPVISNNIIKDNAAKLANDQIMGTGGGIYAKDSNISILDNIVRNNQAGDGGGITIEGGENVLIQGNTIQNNISYSYVGGAGIHAIQTHITITQNNITENSTSNESGYYPFGGGIFLEGPETSAVCSYNRIGNNHSFGYGAGILITDEANVNIHHELLFKNSRISESYSIGGTISISGSGLNKMAKVTIDQCTIVDNNKLGYYGGNGIYIQDHSNTEVMNCILWGNGGRDILHEGDNTSFSIRYSNAEQSFDGEGNISYIPEFANPDQDDYHLKSKGGRWDQTTNDGMGDWVIDDKHSLCIDAGNPLSPWDNESEPNGSRVNLGCYGNTTEASLHFKPTPRDPCQMSHNTIHWCVEDHIPVMLYPQPNCPVGNPVTVSFGMPFPPCILSDPNLIRVLDQQGNEIPAYVEVLLPWRDLSSYTDFEYIRSALIQISYLFTDRITPISLTIETGTQRTKNIETKVPVRENWTLVDDKTFPAQYGVYEPIVYATLPPCWLGACAIKSYCIPYHTFEDFDWYDDALTNDDPTINDGQNFFKTMINDDERVMDTGSDINLIHYLRPGNSGFDGDYEPWLYDRAMTMYAIYIRSGNIDVLRQAHRNTFYYASQISEDGYFNMKWEGGQPSKDLKYSYAESMLTDLILMGDMGNIQGIEKTGLAAAEHNYVYDTLTNTFWTERHFAFAWLINIVAFEATGKMDYALRAMDQADYIFHFQENPPSHPDHGQAPYTGALMHSMVKHEGWWEASQPYWIFSPWMTTLLIDAMQRYHLHSGDERVLLSAQRFADAVINHANQIRNHWIGYEKGLPQPWYLAGYESGWTDSDVDYEHCMDVAKITAFASYCSVLAKQLNEDYLNETKSLLDGANLVIWDIWVRPAGPDYHKSIYRLAPPRKGNWWFRTTQDIDFLVKPPDVSIEQWMNY